MDIDKLYRLQGQDTDKSFSEKLGISRSQLWRIKTGKSYPGIDFIEKFLRCYPEEPFGEYFFVLNVADTQHDIKDGANDKPEDD